MKHLVLLKSLSCGFALFLTVAGSGRAQEAVPLEEAQKIARKLASISGGVSDTPFIVDVDAEHPVGLKGGDAGVIILPDKRLTADVVKGADKAFVPVAQFWAHKVTLATGGSGLPSDKVRVLTVGEGEQSRSVHLFFLGVSKNAQGGLELGVFGKGPEPLYRVALKGVGAGKQGFPIELTGEKTGEGAARLTVNLVGQYAADLEVIKED